MKKKKKIKWAAKKKKEKHTQIRNRKELPKM